MARLLRAMHPEICSTEVSTRPVYQLDPLQDPRWAEFVDRHPHSSVFHTVPWLEALQQTYGYEPIAYTTSPPESRLEDGLVACRVTSWITGRRLVSLPFSDHCEPLTRTVADEQVFVSSMERALQSENLRYVEIRASQELGSSNRLSRSTHTYFFHQLDLRPELNTLFANCHKSSTQRKILRAGREGLICETGRSQALLDAFFNLLLITRRRHGIPPQPKKWFRNLIDCFGDALQIRVAWKDKQPVAAILTLLHKSTLVYKYGCSDTRFNNLGGTQLLFWTSIREAKREGLLAFDLGRSDCDNEGLLRFKDRWGSTRSILNYSRFAVLPPSVGVHLEGVQWPARIARSMVPCLPSCFLRIIGSALYKHIG
jgi:hypothetical protein